MTHKQIVAAYKRCVPKPWFLTREHYLAALNPYYPATKNPLDPDSNPWNQMSEQDKYLFCQLRLREQINYYLEKDSDDKRIWDDQYISDFVKKWGQDKIERLIMEQKQDLAKASVVTVVEEFLPGRKMKIHLTKWADDTEADVLARNKLYP